MDELVNAFEGVAALMGALVVAIFVVAVALVGYVIVSISYMQIMECLGMPKSYAWIPFYRQYLAGDYASRMTDTSFGVLAPYIKWCWCFAGLASGIPVIGSFVAFVVGIFNYVVKIVSVYKSQNNSVGLAVLTAIFPAFWGFIVGKQDVQ